MKRLLFSSLILINLASMLYGQQQTDALITVRRADLPPDILARVEEQAQLQRIDERVKQYGEWVGIGKEIGIAVNDGLEAVTEQASNFADTTPGKITIAVIVWKVIGQELMGFIVGIPLLITITWLFVWAWRALYRGKFVVSGYDAQGKKQYTFVEPACTTMQNGKPGEVSDTQAATIVLVIAYVVGVVAIVGLVMF